MVELVADIGSTDGIGSGVMAGASPDNLVFAIHNHLGNAFQLLDSSVGAINASEQYLACKSAQKELDELAGSLFRAQQNDILSERLFLRFNARIRSLIDQISDIIDTEYS